MARMWITDYEERGRWGLMKGKGWNKGKIEERKDKIDRLGKKERWKMKNERNKVEEARYEEKGKVKELMGKEFLRWKNR